ncbi:MAG: hypothetical protein U1F67_06680 [Rubrivivax sp.]
MSADTTAPSVATLAKGALRRLARGTAGTDARELRRAYADEMGGLPVRAKGASAPAAPTPWPALVERLVRNLDRGGRRGPRRGARRVCSG